MKKMLTLLVAGLMAVSMTACGGSKDNADRELIVSTTGMNQMFMNSDALGNNAYDKNIRDVIYGYETYALDSTGEFQLNKTAIKDVQTSEADRTNEAGKAVKDKTYTFTLNDGLVFSDGSALTAKDYVFHLLLATSDELVAAEGGTAEGEFILGYKAYHEGTADRLAGVKYIDDKTFSITIDGTNLPYFWEYSLVAVRPDSMKVIAGKDADIDSNDQGAMLSTSMGDAIQNWTTTENKTPSVTAGPYKFVSYENKQVKLEINDKFLGDPEGNKPSIKKVVVKEVSATTDMDSFLKGETDILSDQIEGDKIDKAKKAKDDVQYTHYSRNGSGTMPFHCDFGPTKEAEVRRAINFLLDKDEIVKNICGGYGSTINSDYSIAQWMWTKAKDELESKFKYNYAFSVDNANAELDKSSYRFEKDGVTPFDSSKASKDYLRYNAKGEMLQINHLGSEDNTITDNIEILLLDACPKAGINFTLTRSDFPGLLDNYYYGAKKADSERIYHTFNMGSDYSDAPDPYLASYASEYAGTTANAYNIRDEKLDALMQDLRHTDKDDREGFLAKWEAYEIYYNELLPMAPTYANDRHSFATTDLDGFNVNSFQSWAQTICQLSWK